MTSGSRALADRFDPAAAAQTAPGGCGPTRVLVGEVPPAIQAAAGYAAPFAGCWVLTLRWAGHMATLALEYAAP